MILEPFEPFIGQHCETTATGSLLKQVGFSLSEPMLFGLGEGLGFTYWNMKSMDFPFIGGRVKTDLLTQNIAAKLPIQLEVEETSSPKKAWKNVQSKLENGQAVGLKLDCYHLEYFSNPIHFAGHYAVMYGYNDADAYLVDTAQQGSLVKTSLKSLAKARSEKGPMSSKNLSYTLTKTAEDFDLKAAIKVSLQKNASTFLNPPIKNIGLKGIRKASLELPKWFKRSQDIERDFTTTAMIMEKAGTGGALFRNFYRDFLKEGYNLLGDSNLSEAHDLFVDSALSWTEVAGLLDKAGRSQKLEFIHEASELLNDIALKEEQAMTMLLRA